MTACINFLHGSVKLIFPESFFQFSLFLFPKLKNVILICVICIPLHDISKTPNFYSVALKCSLFILKPNIFLFSLWMRANAKCKKSYIHIFSKYLLAFTLRDSFTEAAAILDPGRTNCGKHLNILSTRFIRDFNIFFTFEHNIISFFFVFYRLNT